MLKDSRLIPLTSTPTTPLPSSSFFFFAHTLCRSGYANFPRPWVTIRSLSPRGHKRPCNYSTPVFHSRGFRWLSSDTIAHIPKQSAGRGKNPRSSHLSPPAHTLDGSAARISMHDFLMIWRGEREKNKQDGQSHKAIWRDNIDLCVTLSVWVSVYEYMCSICHTESMIPLRAWKPPHTGNTCSTESAIVAS